MYLREMRSTQRLSREGEVAISKRIEADREMMLGAIRESPLTLDALLGWRDAFDQGKILLRDIIDLDAIYGSFDRALVGTPGATTSLEVADIRTKARGTSPGGVTGRRGAIGAARTESRSIVGIATFSWFKTEFASSL